MFCVRPNRSISRMIAPSSLSAPVNPENPLLPGAFSNPVRPISLYLNLEDPLLRSALGVAVELASLLRERYPFIRAVFLDEAQHLSDAGIFVKGLVDARLGIPILVTGSSSFHLMSMTRESLAGRADRLRLLPFSLKELMRQENPENPVAARSLCERIFRRQMIHGSYPAVYLAPADQDRVRLLNDLTEALILRDASDLFRIKRVDVFRKLLTLLAGQAGNLVNFSELASVCRVDAGTIHAYVEILKESHIVKVVLYRNQGSGSGCLDFL